MAHPEPDEFGQIEEIFTAVLAAGEAARTEELAARCGNRAHLRAEVESLLAAHARAGHFITSPAIAALGPVEGTPGRLTSGMRVGAFRLLEPIARGGMGEVFRGERADGDFSQTVAIKLLVARVADADALRRFRAERQILAALQHPNIVALLDGGLTATGQPYIVMEHVDGVTIAEFCRLQEVSLTGRLRLFQQLCAAVHFAHRHLVVHRDLKPANVLVTPDGMVKVLDFGIAKLLDERDPAVAGTMPLLAPMTANYASPEQIRGLPATTASDVYGLGVVLYELLAGTRPYETAGLTLDEVIQTVAHRDPARPSAARLDTLPYLRRALAGDLDAIVLKAMAKDPGARYASAAELAADLDRFLGGSPVAAREPSLAYVVRKGVARHRGAFGVAAVALVLLVAALVGAIWQARVAARERERAERRFDDVRELAGALLFKIHDEVAPLAGSTPVRRTIVAEGLKFLERLERESAEDAALQIELAKAYIRIGDVQGKRSAANLGDREGARRSYQRAVALATEAAGSSNASTEALATLANAHLALSMTLDGTDSMEAVRSAHAFASEWRRREPDNVPAAELFARASFFVALRTPPADSLPRWQETDRLYRDLLAREPDSLERMRNVALAQKYIGAYYEQVDDYARAVEHHQNALALDRKRAAAAPLDRGALLDLAISIGNLAHSNAQLGAYEKAVASYRESLEIRQRVSDEDPQDVYARGRVAWTHMSLAWVYEDLRQLTRARQHILKAIELNRTLTATEPAYRTQRGYAYATLARLESAEGRGARACTLYARSRDHFQAGGMLALDAQRVLDQVMAALDACNR